MARPLRIVNIKDVTPCKNSSCDEWKEMGQKGRAWVKPYSWDTIALKYEDFLNSVLKEVQKK